MKLACARMWHSRVFSTLLLIALGAVASLAQDPVGIFENHADVGAVLHPGSATFDAATHTYTLTGSGDNMWLANDAFQVVWKKVPGDVELPGGIAGGTTTGKP